jgi:hypothetical protein
VVAVSGVAAESGSETDTPTLAESFTAGNESLAGVSSWLFPEQETNKMESTNSAEMLNFMVDLF